MTAQDLRERLLLAAQGETCAAVHPETAVELCPHIVNLLREAADEIERLRSALQGFMDFQVSADAEGKKFERFSDLARDYCVLKRKVRQEVGMSRSAVAMGGDDGASDAYAEVLALVREAYNLAKNPSTFREWDVRAARVLGLCPHGMPLIENTCGPCSEGRPNR